jgi:quercetin 2,3-dioxygenase
VSALDQRIVLAPTDGSLGPLLRIADDHLPPGEGYGRHEHRDVDVAAVVLAGSLRHRWGDGADLAAGDVAVLRAGSGLSHDEIAGDDGVRVLQCYLRSGEPGAPPSHEVHRAADGWLDLRRPDARVWLARPRPGEEVVVPPGLLVVRGVDGVLVERQDGRTVAGPGAVLVWQLDTGRPAWADG